MTTSHRTDKNFAGNLSQDPGNQAETSQPATKASKAAQAATLQSERHLLAAATLSSQGRDAFFDRNKTMSEGQMMSRPSRLELTKPGDLAAAQHEQATPPKPLGEKLRFAPSSAALEALDLAVTKSPLRVPAMQISRLHSPEGAGLLFRLANMVSPNLIRDEFGAEYILQESFSRGSFGEVRLAEKKDRVVNQLYVAKEIQLDADLSNGHFYHYTEHPTPELLLDKSLKPNEGQYTNFERLQDEVAAMLAANSPLAPHAILLTPKSAYLLLPPMNGDAFAFVSKLNIYRYHKSLVDLRSATQARNNVPVFGLSRSKVAGAIASNLLKAAAESLTHLHNEGFAHRDIKPDNFLYDQIGHLHLADFGLVTEASDRSRRGTLSYMPFELFNKKRGAPDVFSAQAGDIWATGTSVLEILLGFSPSKIMATVTNSFAKDRKSVEAFHEHYSAYKTLHDAASALTSKKDRVKFFDEQTGASYYYGLLFSQLVKFYPHHYDMVMRSLAPNPEHRPTARQLKKMAYDEAFGPEQADLSGLLRSQQFNLSPAKDLQTTQVRAALRTAVGQKAFERWDSWSTNGKDALHLSVLEHDTKAFFEPAPFAKVKK